MFLFVFGFSCVFLAFSVCFFHFATSSCQFSAFSSFLWSFQFATHFAKFHVAVSQISHGSSVLRLFLAILLLFSIFLRCCGLFLSIGYMLLSFRYISFRFYADLMCSFDLRHFGFTLPACCLVRDGNQSGKPDSECPSGTRKFDSKITDKQERTTKQPETTSCTKLCRKRQQYHKGYHKE